MCCGPKQIETTKHDLEIEERLLSDYWPEQRWYCPVSCDLMRGCNMYHKMIVGMIHVTLIEEISI